MHGNTRMQEEMPCDTISGDRHGFHDVFFWYHHDCIPSPPGQPDKDRGRKVTCDSEYCSTIYTLYIITHLGVCVPYRNHHVSRAAQSLCVEKHLDLLICRLGTIVKVDAVSSIFRKMNFESTCVWIG